MTNIGTFYGYDFIIPDSGGKAGKGCNKTGSVQLRAHSRIVKQFRFRTTDGDHVIVVAKRAKKWAQEHPVEGPQP